MTDNDTITLKDAAIHFGFSVYTLRAEAERGHLTTYKIGKRLYTTPADIRDMISACRVSQKGRDFTSIPAGHRNDSNMRRKPPRLYLQKSEDRPARWTVRDGSLMIRTGALEHETDKARDVLHTHMFATGQLNTPSPP